MGIANKNSGEENSGLYDLKELATSAKKRRTQRLSSEMDAQQSLLQSSAALDAVALPDPKKSQEIAIPRMGLDIASGANTTKSASTNASVAIAAADVPQERSSSKAWLLAGVAVIAVAGAAAFVLLKGDSGSNGASTPAPGAAVANAESEVATPVQALPAIVDDQEAEALASEEVEVPTVAALDTDLEDDTVAPDTQDQAPKDKAATHKALGLADPKNVESDKKVVDKPVAESDDHKAKTARESKEATAKTEDKSAKSDGAASVDDILSSVTGGVEKQEAVDEDKGPSKKQLERGDIAKAMKKISPQAKACYSEEEFSGVVTIKYSVGPDGSVTGARATGAHASSKTGACVVSAVNKATFPPFSGATTSFSFPFLLSP